MPSSERHTRSWQSKGIRPHNLGTFLSPYGDRLIVSDISNDEALSLVQTMRDELISLRTTDPVSGYAAEDEINEAVNHLDAAIVDLQRASNDE